MTPTSARLSELFRHMGLSLGLFEPPLTEVRAVAVGPTKSGKTTFFSSLAAASAQASTGLQVVPDNSGAAELSAEFERILLTGGGRNTESSYEYTEYVYQVLSASGRSYDLTIADAPGGWIFDREGRQEQGYQRLIEYCATADVLVLTVDSTAPDQFASIAFELQPFLQTLRSHRVKPLQRVLILLTKIDRLVALAYEDTIDALQKGLRIEQLEPGQRIFARPNISMREAADYVNPLRTAYATLGGRLISMGHGLRGNSRVAVGTMSVFGFDQFDGNPLWRSRPDGRPLPGEEGIELSLAWEPYGVMEAVQFMLTGEIGRTLDIVPRGLDWRMK
jgi:hypothetical protein